MTQRPVYTPLRQRRQSGLIAMLVLTDLALIAFSTVMAMEARQSLPFFPDEGHDVELLVTPFAIGLVPLWVLALALAGAYRKKFLGSGPLEYKVVVNTSMVVAGLLGITAYLYNYPLSRGFFVMVFLIGIPLLVAGRLILRKLLHRARERGRLTVSTLIAGDPEHVADLLKVLTREKWLGYRPVGLLMRDEQGPTPNLGVPVLGRPRQAIDAIRVSKARAVIFAEGSFNRSHDFNRIAIELENVDAQTIVVPSLADISADRMMVRPVAGIPLVHVDRPQALRAAHWSKRAFDLLGSTLLLLVCAPLLMAVVLAIKLDDGGPVLFRQERVGLRGKPFYMLKFRSMVVNAEQLRAQLADQNEFDGTLFKMAADPRITRVGRFLRRFSIDEMPQFFNVWRGDMSLVGPRPALRQEVDTYKAHVLRRLDVRPGITGLWQVSGRSDLDWDETVRLDLYYVDNWSMLQDIVILLRTVSAVLSARGAY